MKALLMSLVTLALSTGAFAQDEDDTTGNMEPQSTSSQQHPGDETPQHTQPPTPGEQTLQHEIAEMPAEAGPEPAEANAAPRSERVRRATADELGEEEQEAEVSQEDEAEADTSSPVDASEDSHAAEDASERRTDRPNPL